MKIFLSSNIQVWQKRNYISYQKIVLANFASFCWAYRTRFCFSWSYFDYRRHLTTPQTFKCRYGRIYISSVQFRTLRPPRGSRICFPVFWKLSTTRSTIQSNVTATYNCRLNESMELHPGVNKLSIQVLGSKIVTY